MKKNIQVLEKILQICQNAKDPSYITLADFEDTEFEKMIREYEGTDTDWYAIKPTPEIMIEFDSADYNYELNHIWYEDKDYGYEIDDLQDLIDELKNKK